MSDKKQLLEILAEFGHEGVDSVNMFDALDIIATCSKGWTADLAAAVYWQNVTGLPAGSE